MTSGSVLCLLPIVLPIATQPLNRCHRESAVWGTIGDTDFSVFLTIHLISSCATAVRPKISLHVWHWEPLLYLILCPTDSWTHNHKWGQTGTAVLQAVSLQHAGLNNRNISITSSDLVPPSYQLSVWTKWLLWQTRAGLFPSLVWQIKIVIIDIMIF